MALSPEVFNVSLQTQLDAAEKKIDDRLTDAARVRPSFDGTVYIQADGINQQMIDWLRPKYLAVGWASMTKDASWINFTHVPKFKHTTIKVTPPEEVVLGRRKITV